MDTPGDPRQAPAPCGVQHDSLGVRACMREHVIRADTKQTHSTVSGPFLRMRSTKRNGALDMGAIEASGDTCALFQKTHPAAMWADFKRPGSSRMCREPALEG